MTGSEKMPIRAQQLWFTGLEKVEVREQIITGPNANELLVETECSAISAGTELLVYRGQIPNEMALDANIAALQAQQTYPLQYGYACVGVVKAIGSDVDDHWLGRRVFAFQPHASHFLAAPADLIAVPDDIAADDAIFLPNMETAVNLVHDGSPVLGERVVVLGQGIVGLLTASLLARFPLAQLHSVDRIALRRKRSLECGVTAAFDPTAAADMSALKTQLKNTETNDGADLIYEVSGAPDALNLAIDLSGFASRIIIGSWYGSKTASIALGGSAHRNRLSISTSQVSSIAPQISGRWDKTRRFNFSWQMLRELRPNQLITHRATLVDAPVIYRHLHEASSDIVQAIFAYAQS